MNNPCEKIKDKLADYALGFLDEEEKAVINEHIKCCPECKTHLGLLQNERSILLQLGENIESQMNARQDKVIRALEKIPAEKLNQFKVFNLNRITKFAAAAVIIVVIIISIYVLDKSVTPAYAVEQTIDALKEVKTVHMAGEFYLQGEFECWLRFDGNPDVPTHMWLSLPRIHMAKICSPEGLFHFNNRTKYLYFINQDQRDKTWIIKFGSFFKDTAEGPVGVVGAGRIDSIDIYNEKEFIVVHIKSQEREQKFFVDTETKLPVSFKTTREDNPMEMITKQQFTVKNIEWFHYNEEPPEEIFDKPVNAKVVENDYDCWVDPNSGLVADGMTRQQVCLDIVRQMEQAFINLDIYTLGKLNLVFLCFPPEIIEQWRQMKESGSWLNELVVTGDVYEQNGFWYVPCELLLNDGKREVYTPMIKFYEMEGKTICIIVGSKEDGIVD